MTKRLVRKRDWQNKSGVSEVVGSILILLMTVTLFSGIILWVWGLETPSAISWVDIGAEFDPIDIQQEDPPDWDITYINLTHRGGEELKGAFSEFYLVVNGTAEVLDVVKFGDDRTGEGEEYGISGNDNNWNIGEVWQVKNWSIEYHHKVRITLVDRHTSTVLWEKNLWGYEGARPPIFVEMWADGNPHVNSSEVRDPVEDNKTDIYSGDPIPFGIFAKVIDLDGDLLNHSVYAKFTFGPLDGNEYMMVDNGSEMYCDAAAGDSVFSLCKDEFWPGSDWLQWSGGLIILNATDAEDHETTTRLTLRVFNYGDRVYQDITTEVTGNATNAKPLEYAIFEEVEWVAYGQGYVITNTEDRNNSYYNRSVYIFNWTDTIQVKVLSNILNNAYKMNLFRLYDAGTGAVLTPPSNLKFVHAGVVASYHKYVLNFTASSIQGIQASKGGCFNVYIEIRDTDDDLFSTHSWIEVKKSGGGAPECPHIELFQDSSYSTESKYFNSWDFMYVEVEPANATDNNVQSITIEIQDFWGNSQIRSGPITYVATCHTGGFGPVTGMCIGGTPQAYRFRIDLLKGDKDPWLLGNASYTLFLRIVTDNNEYYENLNINMYINSSASVMDIVSGMAQAKGQGTYADEYYGFFYENFGGYWEGNPYAIRSGQTGQTDTIGEIYSVVFTDMDNDLDKDIVATLEGGDNRHSYLALYDNYNGRGRFSRTNIDDYTQNQKEFCSVATGDVNDDNLWDIVAGTDDGKLFYYSNDGVWDRTATIATGIGVPASDKENGGHGIVIADVDGDKYKEVIVGTSTGFRVYKNQSDSETVWDLKYSDTTGNIVSVDWGEVGYPSVDNGLNDFAVGYTTGAVAVYLNGGGYSFTRVDVDTDARGAIAAVGIGNMDDTNDWDEIVSGSGRKILIYYTSSHGESGTWNHYANDDDSGASTRPNAGGDIGGDIKSIQVGNIDGLIEDDIAISTTNARVYFYKNIRDASDWQRFIVDDINGWLGSTPVIYTISAGDMNMGNPIL